jgi:hypothetical protein
VNRSAELGARPRPLAAILVALAASALFAPAVFAFHRHLSPEQVHEAYFVGRDQHHRDAFFAAYVHQPQQPDTGPNVQIIEFRTPYEQVAIRSRDNSWSNYSPSDAEHDYESLSPEVIVRVLIYETQTFSFSATDAQPDTAGFKFHISQHGRAMDYAKVTVDDAVPVGAGSYGSAGLGGIDIQLHVPVSGFKSSDPVTVKVLAPTGQTYSTTFDLAILQ